MTPLFASFVGKVKGQFSQGWCVFMHVPPLVTGHDIENLIRTLEKERGYDPGTLVLVNFRRMEAPLP